MASTTMQQMVSPQETVELLQTLIKIPSVNGNEKQIGEFLYEYFTQLGFETTLYEVEKNRPAVVAVLHGKSTGKTLMYTTHYDTHVTDNMEIQPFTPLIEGNRIYGRGSCDAKGSIAAMIMSALILQRSGCHFSGNLMLAFVPDEEYLNKGTTYLMNHGITADFAVVGEPTEMVIGHGHRGCTHLDIVVKGKAYHSAYPEKGINAIEKMATLLLSLRKHLISKFKEKEHPFLGHPVINLGLISGGTRIHTVADLCCASFLRRDLPEESTEMILNEIQEHLDELLNDDSQLDAHVSLSTIQQRIRLPYFLDPDHPLIDAMKESYYRITAQPPTTGVMNYFCDASILCTEHNIPTIIFGPGSIQVAHSSIEYIELRQLTESVYIYADLAMTLLQPNYKGAL